MDFVLKVVDFVLKMVDFVLQMVDFVLQMVRQMRTLSFYLINKTLGVDRHRDDIVELAGWLPTIGEMSVGEDQWDSRETFVDDRGEPISYQVFKNHEFCIENHELCIKDHGFCIKDHEFCIENDEFCIENDELPEAVLAVSGEPHAAPASWRPERCGFSALLLLCFTMFALFCAVFALLFGAKNDEFVVFALCFGAENGGCFDRLPPQSKGRASRYVSAFVIQNSAFYNTNF